MYTIKQASIRTGVSIPLLRAWERRYGVPSPARTESRYRLYDDVSIARVRRMRELVDSGWAPSQAARAVLEEPPETLVPPEGTNAAVGVPLRPAAVETADAGTRDVVAGNGGAFAARFVAAARGLDEPALEGLLVEAIAELGVDRAADEAILPALVAVGEAWADGELDVAAEHLASNAVMRRLAALYDAAGTGSGRGVVVGLPPGGRHEAGALAFAVACRRAGLAVSYLGADVPLESWLAAVEEQRPAAVAIGAVTAAEADAAAAVAAALCREHPNLVVALGGASNERAAAEDGASGAVVLPDELREAVAALDAAVRSAAAAPRTPRVS